MSSTDVRFEGRVITEGDVKAFFSARSASAVCPVCSKNDWSILLGDGYNAFACIDGYVEDEAGTVQPAKNYVPVFGVSCTNCGHVRLHMLYVLNAWLQQRDVVVSATTPEGGAGA